MSYQDIYLRLICSKLKLKKKDILEYVNLYLFDYSIEIAQKLQEEIIGKEINFEDYNTLIHKIEKGNLDLLRVDKIKIKGDIYLIGLLCDPFELYDNPSLINLIEVTAERLEYLSTVFKSWK